MNPSLKAFLYGLTIGLGPLGACAFLYYVVAPLLPDNPGTLLSFGVIALFFIGSIAVFVISIILINRKLRISGLTALAVLLIEVVAVVYWLDAA